MAVTGDCLLKHFKGCYTWRAGILTVIVILCTLPAALVHADAGDMIVQYSVTNAADYAVIDLNVTNNDPGAIYDSATLNIFVPLADQLWALSCNQAAYANKAEMVDDWHLSLRNPPTGEVANGWNAVLNADGSVSLSHISGIPGLSYDVWYSTSDNPDLDMMALTLFIPSSQLETDGDPGYDVAPDKQIELGTGVLEQAFMGRTTTGFDIPQAAYEYDVVDAAANGLVTISAAGVVGLPPLVDFTVTNHSTTILNALYLRADGVYDVRCDTAGWTAHIFSPVDNIDTNGDGVYDRGVQLLPDAAGLAPGQSIQFRINSAYGHNLASSTALATLDFDSMVDCNSVLLDGSITGDIDGDGYVDVNDLAVMAGDWLTADANSPANLNDDGIVNLADLARLAGNWIFEPFIIDTDLEPEDMICQHTVTNAPDYAVIDLNVTNNDPGAIYDSATLDIFVPLANQLWNMLCNQSTYTSKAEMIAAWAFGIRADSGEVATGWNAVVNSDGSVSLSHSGLGYDRWYSTSENPDQDTMAFTLFVPSGQLEADGVAGYDINADARIELGNKTMDWAFYANTGTPKTAFEYEVIVP